VVCFGKKTKITQKILVVVIVVVTQKATKSRKKKKKNERINEQKLIDYTSKI